LQMLQQRVVELLPLRLRELGEGSIEGGMVRDTSELQGLAHWVGGKELFFQIAVGAVARDFEHHAGGALGEGVVVSAFWVGLGGECLLGDVVSEFCDTDQSAFSHRRCPPQGLFHIATTLCNRAGKSPVAGGVGQSARSSGVP